MIARPSKAPASCPVSIKRVWLFGLLLLTVGSYAACGDAPADVTTELALLRDGQRISTELPLQLGTFKFEPDGDPDRIVLTIQNIGETPVDAGAPDAVFIENDSALAFRLSRSGLGVLAPTARADMQLLFTPPATGTWEATLVVDSPNALGGPKRFRINATSTTESIEPTVALAFVDSAGAPVTRLDFGYIAAEDDAKREVRLRNDGNVPFTFALADLIPADVSIPVVISADMEGAIAPGGAVNLLFKASPLSCGIYDTTYAIGGDGSGPLLATLKVGWTSAPDLFRVTEMVTTTPPEHWIALAARERGGARVVIGDSADNSFSGKALWLDFDGCEASTGLPLNDSLAGGNNLWGHRVATDAEGKLALVTSSDRAEAWLLPLGQQAGTPPAGYRLGTFNSKGGHGQGAAFARDASVACVGQTLADSGFNAHGGVWLYRRPSASWDDLSEANFRLVPLEPPRVSDLGRAIAMSATGDVIVGGGLYMTSVTVTDVFEAALFVWASSLDPTLGRTWGRLVPGQDGDRRTESFLLRSLKTPIDGQMSVGASDDGSVLALAFKSDFTIVEVHIFEAGQDGLWGIAGDPPTRRVANHVVSVDAFNQWGFALSPDGRRFIVSDDFGVVSVAMNGDTWGQGSSLEKTWPTPLAGQITFDPSGGQLGGFGPDGALVIMQLNAEAP